MIGFTKLHSDKGQDTEKESRMSRKNVVNESSADKIDMGSQYAMTEKA